MATGIDTLASQAFGAKNNRLVGVVFVRGTLLTALIFFVPVTILWYYMGTVVLMLGQDPAVAEVTGTFTRAYVWGMVPYVVFENAKRCLQAQNIAVPEMIVGILGVVANIGFHQLTMGTLGWGAYGAGLALSTTWFFMLGIFVVAIAIFKLGGGDWWSGICSCDVFLGWPEYLRLCIPGLVGVFIEWTAWEASVFISGMAGKEDLATQGILLSTYGLVFSAALAISIGANISVGNRLGEHNPDSARESAWGAISIAFWTALLVAGGLGLGARLWPRLFGVSESGISKIVELAPLYAVVQFLDIVQITCTGILKGMGRQRVQAQATFVAFYLGAVPLMAYLVFNLKWGVRGLWTGIGIAELPLLAFYLYVIYNANWKELAEATHRRLSTHLVGASPSVSSGSDLEWHGVV
ncbi:unnamed protein product [Ascophyllum nodosum]